MRPAKQPIQIPLCDQPCPSKSPAPSLRRRWAGRWTPLEILVGRRLRGTSISAHGTGEVQDAASIVESRFTYQVSTCVDGGWFHTFGRRDHSNSLNTSEHHHTRSRSCTLYRKADRIAISARKGWCPPLDLIVRAVHGSRWSAHKEKLSILVEREYHLNPDPFYTPMGDVIERNQANPWLEPQQTPVKPWRWIPTPEDPSDDFMF
jgi:hypothetical protein